MKPPRPLTTRQAEILAFIRRKLVTDGRVPTMREIGIWFDFASTNGTRDHLIALERKGMITMERLKSRAIRLVVPKGCCAACSQPLPETNP